MLLVILGVPGAAPEAIKTRWKTGAWPRNEEFIARQNLNGLRPFGPKPPPTDANPP